MADQDTGTIVWNEDRTRGTKTTKYCTKTVLPTRLAVRQYIQEAFLLCVEKPETKGSLNPYNILGMAEPGIDHMYRKLMMDQLGILMPGWVEEWKKRVCQIPEENQTDTEFLGSMTRDYRKGCAVCLTDKIMGTTCGCGHTEIAVFRPCGHAMCVNPCFETWMKSNKVTFEPQKLTINGAVFIIPGKRDLSTFTANRFSCPECRTLLRSVFRAEEIELPQGLPWDDWVVDLASSVGFGFWPEEH